MKRSILIILILAVTATAIGVLQHIQLDRLRAYSNALRETNHTIAAPQPPAQEPNTPSTPDSAKFLANVAEFAKAPAAEKSDDVFSPLFTASPETLREILESLDSQELPDTIRDRVAMLSIVTLVVHQPEFAAEAALKYMEQPGFLEHFMNTFAYNHPETAATWFADAKAKNRLPPDRPDLLANIDKKITAAIARTDPARALASAEAATGEHRYELLYTAARTIDDEDAWIALIHQAAAHPDPDFRSTALRAISNGTGRNTDFDEIRHLIPRLDLPAKSLNPFISQAATRSIDDKTPERADWLIANSAPEHLDHNLISLLAAWTNNDFNAAAAWLHNLEPSPARDTAIAEFSTNIAHREPASAAEWALAITDDEKKRITLNNVLATWQKTDPDAAQAYLDSTAP